MFIISNNLAISVPFVEIPERESTTASITLRVVSVSMGAIALTVSILIFYNIPGVGQIGLVGGVGFASSGAIFLIIGALVRELKEKKNHRNTPTITPNRQDEPEARRTVTNQRVLNLEDKKGLENLHSGSQYFCSGRINAAEYREYVDQLNLTAPEGITFNFTPQTQITGGTCSIMSLEFLKDLFSFLKEGKSLENVATCYSSNHKKFKESNEKYRTIQAAMNCITISDPQLAIDEQEIRKIKALMSFYSLEIETATRALNLETEFDQLPPLIKDISDGVYFVRGLMREANNKGETSGHSLVMIKTKNIYFIYEANTGLHKTENINDVAAFIKKQDTTWNIPTFRFFQCKM